MNKIMKLINQLKKKQEKIPIQKMRILKNLKLLIK